MPSSQGGGSSYVSIQYHVDPTKPHETLASQLVNKPASPHQGGFALVSLRAALGACRASCPGHGWSGWHRSSDGGPAQHIAPQQAVTQHSTALDGPAHSNSKQCAAWWQRMSQTFKLIHRCITQWMLKNRRTLQTRDCLQIM